MKMNEQEIETYMDLWMSIKPYIPAKDRLEACEKFLVVVDGIVDLEEVCDEFVGFDGTVDKVIRNNYITHVELDEYDEDDIWD